MRTRYRAIALAVLVVLMLLLAQRSRAAEPCGYGWPGGYYPYHICTAEEITLKTWQVPDGTVLFEMDSFSETAYHRIYKLVPVWTNILTWESQPMPEGAVFTYAPTAAHHFANYRFPATSPGDYWEPDMQLLPMTRIWVPQLALGEQE